MRRLTHDQCYRFTYDMLTAMKSHMADLTHKGQISIYPVPRGGVPVAYLAKAINPSLLIVDSPNDADWIVDDIIDTGSTREKYAGHNFAAMVGKRGLITIDTAGGETVTGCYQFNPFPANTAEWIEFPWENSNWSDDDSIAGTIANRLKSRGVRFFANDNISEHITKTELIDLQKEVEVRVQHLLKGMVIDVDNDHNTQGTAERIASMYINEVFSGRYLPVPEKTEFPNINKLDELMVTGPITIRSACSHHFVPITGKCWIGIIPGQTLIGLSKFNRIVEWIAARPQIQEELVVQIADYIDQEIQPKGLAVVVKATHMCMTWRGVRESDEAAMTNAVVRGALRDLPEARAEFYSMIGL